MLTTRGLVFLLVTLLLTSVGQAAGSAPLAVSGTALLLWFLGAWLLFAARVLGANSRVVLERKLFVDSGDSNGNTEARGTIWAGRTLQVDLQIVHLRGLGFPLVFAIDRPPPLAAGPVGDNHAAGRLTGNNSLRIQYRLTCNSPGRLRFEGVRLLLADLQGFFAHRTFVRSPREIVVLPPLVEGRDRRAFRKRHNLLPLVGSHFHRRTGSGTDLLDVREYMPGDPPKLVAWKLSARRDRLMTREYESEVPIRCTVMVDVGETVRLGTPGRNALTRFVELAAVVLRSADDSRDLTGLVLIEGNRVRQQIRPARGRRHLLNATRALAETANLSPADPSVQLESLLPAAYGLAQDLYPELLVDEVNSFPWWLPLWSPQPVWSIPRPYAPGRTWVGRVGKWVWRRIQEIPMALQTARRSRFSPTYHRMYRYRKQIAAILAHRHEIGPGGVALLLEDDDVLRRHLLRFLADHQAAIPQLFSEGRSESAARERIGVLARSVIQGVHRARDNEVFVLLFDLLEDLDRLGPLLGAVRLAQARHHIVLPICSWPEGIPLPVAGKSPEFPNTEDPLVLLRHAATLKFHHAFAKLRRLFGSMGVACLAASQEDAPLLVLRRLQMLRRLQGGS